MTLTVGKKAPLRTFPPAPKPQANGPGRRERLLEKAIAVKDKERRKVEAERAAREKAVADALAKKRQARQAAIASAVAPVVAGIKALDPRPYTKAITKFSVSSALKVKTAARNAAVATRLQIAETLSAIAQAYRAATSALIRGIRRLDPRPLINAAVSGVRGASTRLALIVSAAYRTVLQGFVDAAATVSNVSAALIARTRAILVPLIHGTITFFKSVGEVSVALWMLARNANPRPLIRAAKHLSIEFIIWVRSLSARSYAAIAEITTPKRVATVGYAAVVVAAVVFAGPRMLDSISTWQAGSSEQTAEIEAPQDSPTLVAEYLQTETQIKDQTEIVLVPEPAPTVTVVANSGAEITPMPFEEHLDAPAKVIQKEDAAGVQRYASISPAARSELGSTAPDTVIDDGLILPARPSTPDGQVVPGEARARIAIVIDDMGMVQGILPDMLALEGPITYAFLPYSPNLKEQTRQTREAGHQLMVHLPMEPKRRTANPGPQALLTALSPEDLAARIAWNLDRFDGYVGVNNHMGSLFTENSAGMRAVITELKARGVFFLDSVTTSNTVGFSLAGEIGVARARRDIFLDNKRSYAAVMKQLKKLERKALREGQAIAIGHPYRVTHQALRDWLPTLRARGFELVAASRLIQPPETKDQTIIKVAGKAAPKTQPRPRITPASSSASGTFE